MGLDSALVHFQWFYAQGQQQLRNSSETAYKAIPTYKDSDGRICRVATGTGPLTWYHDQTPSGMSGLVGNIWEWAGAIRAVFGELQILVNNNGADAAHSQGASSAEWKAINAADGSLITPNGSGTTSGSIKMDFISNTLTWSTSITNKADAWHDIPFSNIKCDSTIGANAKLLLQNLGFLPYEGDTLESAHHCYFDNGLAEICFSSGGGWSGSDYGLASFDYDLRSSTWASLGFRSAYVKLPTA